MKVSEFEIFSKYHFPLRLELDRLDYVNRFMDVRGHAVDPEDVLKFMNAIAQDGVSYPATAVTKLEITETVSLAELDRAVLLNDFGGKPIKFMLPNSGRTIMFSWPTRFVDKSALEHLSDLSNILLDVYNTLLPVSEFVPTFELGCGPYAFAVLESILLPPQTNIYVSGLCAWNEVSVRWINADHALVDRVCREYLKQHFAKDGGK